MSFPCGTYDAVRVLLGEGKGNNWWCVLYPPLCFTDNAGEIVPEASKEELKYLLEEDDFNSLMRNRRIVFGDGKNVSTSSKSEKKVTIHIRSRLWEFATGK